MDYHTYHSTDHKNESRSAGCPTIVYFLPTITLAIFTLLMLVAVIVVPIEVAKVLAVKHTGNAGTRIYPTNKGITVSGITRPGDYVYYRYDHKEKSGDSRVTFCLNSTQKPNVTGYIGLGTKLPTEKNFERHIVANGCKEITVCIAESVYVGIVSTNTKAEQFNLTATRVENDSSECDLTRDLSDTGIIIVTIVAILVLFLCLLLCTLVSICVVCTQGKKSSIARRFADGGAAAYAEATTAAM